MPNTISPTVSAGANVTTRLPSGVDHDTAPAVTMAAKNQWRLLRGAILVGVITLTCAIHDSDL